MPRARTGRTLDARHSTIADNPLNARSCLLTRYASIAQGAEPDLLCLGKALGGGLPVSACVGTAAVMAAWGNTGNEALHTGTFFGNPLVCAAALAALAVLEDEDLALAAVRKGAVLKRALQQSLAAHACVVEIRGMGLAVGVQLDSAARTLAVARRLLERGYIVVTSGPRGDVLSLTPPLTIAEPLLLEFAHALDAALGALP